MIANKSFIAIPSNTPNPAAALLLANYLSSPENQASKLQFLGYAPGIDEPLLNEDQQMTLEQASPELLGVTFSELAERRVPETNASLVDVLETVWLEVIIRGSEEPIEAIIAAALASRE
jgi:putative spermidine/putrescine transport system substrate-binding protein